MSTACLLWPVFTVELITHTISPGHIDKLPAIVFRLSLFYHPRPHPERALYTGDCMVSTAIEGLVIRSEKEGTKNPRVITCGMTGCHFDNLQHHHGQQQWDFPWSLDESATQGSNQPWPWNQVISSCHSHRWLHYSQHQGVCLNIKMSSYQYRDSHYKDKMVLWSFIFIMKIPIPGKIVFILRWALAAILNFLF